MDKTWKQRQMEVLMASFEHETALMASWPGGKEAAEGYAQRLLAYDTKQKAREKGENR